MSAIEAWGRRIADRAARATRARVAGRLRAELGEAVREDDGAVVIEGRRAVARMLVDPALRWVRGMMR